MFSTTLTSRHLGRREFLSLSSLAGLSLPLAGSGYLQAAERSCNQPQARVSFFCISRVGQVSWRRLIQRLMCPDSIRSLGGAIQTSQAGVQVSKWMEKLSAWTHRLAIVRNYQTGTQHGGMLPIISPYSNQAGIGAFYNRIAGANHPQTGLPHSAALSAQVR